jgi:UDP-2,3-diacylglucosamine pyrophosphatase LpxH
VHLGCPHAQAGLAVEMLQQYLPDRLYLVGDIVDGWRLSQRWYWEPVYSQFLRELHLLIEAGTRIFYTPGNHDDFLRLPENGALLRQIPGVRVADSFVHTTADGRRLLVTHGDLCDPVECGSRWLSQAGAAGFDVLLKLDDLWERWMRVPGRRRFPLSSAVKRRVKRFLAAVSHFQETLLESARLQQCDGVVCGHVHTPEIAEVEHLIYCNAGDWIGSCTFLVERDDGRVDLLESADGGRHRVLRTSRRGVQSHSPVQPEVALVSGDRESHDPCV